MTNQEFDFFKKAIKEHNRYLKEIDSDFKAIAAAIKESCRVAHTITIDEPIPPEITKNALGNCIE